MDLMRKTHSDKLDKRSPTNIFNCIVQYMRILGLVSASRPLLKFIKSGSPLLYFCAVNRSQSSFSGMHTGLEPEQVITALPPYHN